MKPKTAKMKTEVFPNGRIETGITDLAGEYSKWVIETQDESTRQALKTLGWIPPEVAQKIVTIVEEGGDLWGCEEYKQFRDIVWKGEHIND